MEGREESRPNIILITTDQQRYDTLGINGSHPLVSTPHIDALAGPGVHFTNAYSQNTVCVPSRACLQTGRYTHQHGVTYMENVVDDTPGLPDWELTFMEHLQAHGYHTGATGKIHMYPAKGFDWQRLCGGKGQRWLVSEGSPLGPGPLGPVYALPGWRKNARGPTKRCTPSAGASHRIALWVLWICPCPLTSMWTTGWPKNRFASSTRPHRGTRHSFCGVGSAARMVRSILPNRTDR